MPTLGELLNARLGAGLDDASELVDVRTLLPPGLSLREARSELARLLSADVPSSRAYQSARRAAERYLPAPGRRAVRPKPATVRRLRRATDNRLEGFRRGGGEMKIEVLWYQARRKWERLPPGPRWVHIPRDSMRRVIRLWQDGEHDEAAADLFVEWAQQYGIPNPADWLVGVEIRALWLEPGYRV